MVLKEWRGTGLKEDTDFAPYQMVHPSNNHEITDVCGNYRYGQAIINVS